MDMTPEDQAKQISEASTGVKTLTERFAYLSEKFSDMNFLLIALIVVLFVGFAGCFIAATAMLVDSFNSKAASYQELEKQVQNQNVKIDTLNQQLQLEGKLDQKG